MIKKKRESSTQRTKIIIYNKQKQLKCTSKSKHFCINEKTKIVGLREVAWDVCPNSQNAIENCTNTLERMPTVN